MTKVIIPTKMCDHVQKFTNLFTFSIFRLKLLSLFFVLYV